MSKERDLLKRWVLAFGDIHPDIKVLKETQELLAQPEQEPVACNAIPYEHSDTVSAFNPVSNNYWDR